MRNILLCLILLVLIGIAWWVLPTPIPPKEVGKVVDSWQQVPIYSNGPHVHDTHGKSIAKDGYVYGWKYQCVEWIKRFYDQRLQHRMPDGSGNAQDFWSETISDGQFNARRGLIQFNVPSQWLPQRNDILVFRFKPYGHVALVTDVSKNRVFIRQQNVPGATRDTLYLQFHQNYVRFTDPRIVGWLRHPRNHVF